MPPALAAARWWQAVFTSSSKAVADGIVADADGLASLIDAELAASLAEGVRRTDRQAPLTSLSRSGLLPCGHDS